MAPYSSFGCFSVLYEVSSCCSCVLLWRSRNVQSAWGKESFHSLVNCSFRGESQCFKSVQVSSPAAKNISLLSVFWRSRSLLLTRRDWRRTWVRHMKREVRGVFFFFLVYPHFLFPESSVFMSELLCVFSVSHLRLSQEVWAKKHSCKNNEKQVNVNTSNYRLVLQGPAELRGGVFQDKVDGDGNKPWSETVTTD